MLHAILNGKAGALPTDIAGESWRRVYRASEDLLTATTFERLAYLDGAVLWQVLASAFRGGALPQRRVAELLDIQFWPLWQEAAQQIGQAVEPDVVLTFSIGDPAQSVMFIVECKAGTGQQYADQWAREWLAFEAQYPIAERPDEVWLLALGGVPEGPIRTVARLTEQIRLKWGIEVRALAADRSDFARALAEIEVESRVAARIIEDLQQALQLHGYRNVRPMADLVADAARYRISSRSDASLKFARGLGGDHERPRSIATRAFRPMNELVQRTSSNRTQAASQQTIRRYH